MNRHIHNNDNSLYYCYTVYRGCPTILYTIRLMSLSYLCVFCNNMNKKRKIDSYVDFFINEEIKNNIREIIKPIFDTIYNELNIYIWVICFYNIFLVFIILANLFLILKLSNKLSTVTYLEK